MKAQVDGKEIKMKHTPGPWRTNGSFNVECNPETLYLVRNNTGGSKAGELRANANLIASAPDLLEALEMLIDMLDYNGNIDIVRDEGPIEDARIAIAKAKGK
jgi:hypothetical protein